MNAHAVPRFPWITLLLLTVLAVLLAGGGAGLFYSVAPSALERLNAGSGELKMREGERLEAAGAREAAIAAYREALPLAFSGSFNRIHVLKRLGTLLVQQGAYEESLPFLNAYVDDPEGTVQGFEMLCTALLRLENRWAELESAAQRWLARAQAEAHTEEEGRAWYYLALAKMGQGDAEAEAHLRKSAELMPGRQADAELGQWLYQKQAYDEAAFFLRRYLEAGGSGKRAVEVRRLLDALTQIKGESP